MKTYMTKVNDSNIFIGQAEDERAFIDAIIEKNKDEHWAENIFLVEEVKDIQHVTLCAPDEIYSKSV